MLSKNKTFDVRILIIVSFLTIFHYKDVLCLEPSESRLCDCAKIKERAMVRYKKALQSQNVTWPFKDTKKKLKFILTWGGDNSTLARYEQGQQAFFKNKCPKTNCYVTNNRKFLGDDSECCFDAILFDGLKLNSSDIPKTRCYDQKYIFVNFKSPVRYPVCHDIYDNFFNWTLTQRYDSDIFVPFFRIKNRNGKIIGPTDMMKLTNTSNERISKKLKLIWDKKKTAVAFMPTDCETQSHKDELVEQISEDLKKIELKLETYGECGTLSCPKGNDACWRYIEKNDYFYLLFESADPMGSVPDEMVDPLLHYTIPIVYGGANFLRYLPPGSYVDAIKYSVKEVVAMIYNIITSEHQFRKYFSWHNIYKYVKTEAEDICALCSALNEKTMRPRKSYEHFRMWWLHSFEEACCAALP